MRLPLLAAGLVCLFFLSACTNTYTFSNRTDGPLVVSIAMRDHDGAVTEATGAVIDEGQEVELTFKPDRAVTASFWKGVLQQGAPAAAIDLASAPRRMDIVAEGNGLAIAPTSH